MSARIVPFAGWAMPVQYAGVLKEHEAVRTRAGIFDVSHMGELELEGADALAIVDSLVTNDLTKLVDGQAAYTLCCNEAGGILDDLIVSRRDATHVLVVCNAGNRAKISSYFAEAAKGRCGFRDTSDEVALIALQGPRAFDVLAALGNEDLADPALVDRLNLHGRLVGLDLGDDVARRDLVALAHVPFGELALLHGGRQCRHEDRCRHEISARAFLRASPLPSAVRRRA